MKRLTPLLFLLPALASAQDRGALAFNQACAKCHPAEVQKRAFGERGPAGPAMAMVLRKKNLEEIREWTVAPHRINPKTNCDTRLLAPGDLDALMSFLATVTVPTPPPRRMLLRQQLEQGGKQKPREQPESEENAKSQPKNQGKK
ncbi:MULTISPECIES: c-type cytochrome [unclassified Corallococcus]|uniref:c-type cytochrome n=1 Tax=unclassified Corallococcus TaxID=2685029 RepID=UPI001A8D75F4|nr:MULTISPECIES: c-type cytochrome [unclassified Corallococcus]MBN9688238.1 c-type cytochrome [Corallococcus sp. NCSPR001]WAS87958.1 c-type cytochrome [Corallococcus sp. NCRR]